MYPKKGAIAGHISKSIESMVTRDYEILSDAKIQIMRIPNF
jgi:hypothetical protein